MKSSQMGSTHIIVFIFVGAFTFVLSGLPVVRTAQSQLIGVLTSVTSPVTSVTNKLDDVVRFVSDLQVIHDQNRALQDQVATLNQQLSELRTVEEQNTWLTSQLNLKNTKYKEGQLVSVVRYEYVPSPGYIYVYIGAGSTVKEKDWATTYDYVVGQVASVAGNYAKIKLINAPDSSIPIKVGQSSNLGVLKGNLGIDSKVVGVAASSDVKINDELKLVDASNANLERYTLGKVKDITGSDAESTKELKIEMPVDLLSLTYLVLVPAHVYKNTTTHYHFSNLYLLGRSI